MPNKDLPRAYARPVESSTSSSSSQEQTSSTSSGKRTYGKTSSSSSSSSTSAFSRSSRDRRRKRGYGARRSSTSSSRSRSPQSSTDRRRKRRNSKSKSSSRDSYDRRRKTHSRSTYHNWKHRDATRHRTSGTKRTFSPRPVTGRTPRRCYTCECGVRYASKKALIHHTIQNHDAHIPCFGCDQNLSSLSQLLKHFQTIHSDSLILCVYCKSVFGKANAMTEDQWKRLKTHMYGEVVYAKLADMQG